MSSKTITIEIFRDGAMCFIPVPFDPKSVFGKVRAPVKVTLNGYTYRSTIAAMKGLTCIPLRRCNREAAGLNGGETIDVTIELDTEPRKVEIPEDLSRALRANDVASEKWRSLSYTRRREYAEAIESAKRPETRARRVATTIRLLHDK